MYFEPSVSALPLHGRSEVDRHRRDNGGREERDDQRQADAEVAEQGVAAQALEELH